MEPSTHERVLESAAHCFARSGYKKTSIDTVAKRAGVAKGTVYLHCESKEDLFYQAVHRELRRWVADMSENLDRRRPANVLMLELAARDADFVAKRPLVRDLLFGMLHSLLPDWAARFEELRALGLRHVIELLELGIEQGVFERDLDVQATARVLQDMQIAGTLLGHRTKLEPDEVRRLQLASVRLVMKGLERR